LLSSYSPHGHETWKQDGHLTYLHAQTGLGPSEGQHFDLDPLTFAHHISHIGHSAFPPELRDVHQAFPPLPEGESDTSGVCVKVYLPKPISTLIGNEQKKMVGGGGRGEK
jgi:hypothetical protein